LRSPDNGLRLGSIPCRASLRASAAIRRTSSMLKLGKSREYLPSHL
jgi:hypothetical protein